MWLLGYDFTYVVGKAAKQLTESDKIISIYQTNV